MTKTVYAVETLRAGQQRPYAASVYEYRITVQREHYAKPHDLRPWLLLGDVEAQIKRDEAMRQAGTMSGGTPPNELRALQRSWAIGLVKTLGCNFREKSDDDGRTGMEAAFYPTLQSLTMDPVTGVIHAIVTAAYID